MRKTKVLAVAAAICGISLTGVAAPAIAAPADAPARTSTINTAAESPLSVDKPVVARGEAVRITINHGPEGMNWVLSDAFTGKEQNPVGGTEGVAAIVGDENGIATATATIDDVPPGVYEIQARVGGGVVPPITITVQ